MDTLTREQQVAPQATSAETEEATTNEGAPLGERYTNAGQIPAPLDTGPPGREEDARPSASELAYSSASSFSLQTAGLAPDTAEQDGNTSGGGSRSFRVKVPPDGNPRRMLIDILRKEYGLNEADVQVLLATWRIANSNDNTATAKDMLASAKRGGGYVIIDIPAGEDAFLRRFKQQQRGQATTHVGAVLAANVPPDLRAKVEPALDDLVGGDAAARNAAATRLQALIYSGNITGSAAKQLRQAIDGLLVHFERGDDQMLAMLRVQLVVAENPVNLELADTLPKSVDIFNPGADLRSENLIAAQAQSQKARAEIEKIEQELDRRQDAGTLDRSEAAKLYDMAAFLHEAYTGDKAAASEARYMARMFRSDDAERARAAKQLATPGRKRPLVNSRVAPGDQPSMRASTPEERELSKLEADRATATATWSGADNRAKVPEFPKTTTFDRGNLDPSSSSGESRRHDKVDAAGGAVSLASTMLLWYATHQRMTQLAEWSKREAELNDKITKDSTDPVPPRPAELLQVIGELEQRANQLAATDTNGSEQNRLWANRLRGTLRAAQAFWDRRN